MPDKYPPFAALAAREQEDVDYRIVALRRESPTIVIAPHGGQIEPGTSEIARSVAGDDWSLYCFEGLRSGRPHGDLHISSSKFDEPKGCAMVGAADIVIAIHGRADRTDTSTIWMGGLARELSDSVEKQLSLAGFKAKAAGHDLSGRDLNNICNRGRRKAGVQLELPRTLRDAMRNDPQRLTCFADAVRLAIQEK